MISDQLTEKLNEQIQEELQSEMYYLGMAAYFKQEDWNGFAHFMRVQAEEEREHALKFYDFLAEVDQPIRVPGTEAPSSDFSSISEVFETALEQEQHITGKIHEALNLAREQNDYEAESLLQWFVDEQVEEENLMRGVLRQVRRAEREETGLLLLDQKLGERGSGDSFDL